MYLAKQQGSKSIFKYQRHFYAPTMKDQNQKSGGKNPICYSNKKNKVPRDKLYQVGERPVLRKLHNTKERN